MATDSLAVYRKFSKVRKSLIQVAQLWVARDHLMLVTSIFAFETYRRFYFKDIEAVVIRMTKARRDWMIVNAICLLLFGGMAAGILLGDPAGDDATQAGGWIFVSFASLFLVLLVVMAALGPTCAVFLQTRSGLVKLPLFNRLRRALQMRDRLAQLMAEQAAASAATP